MSYDGERVCPNNEPFTSNTQMKGIFLQKDLLLLHFTNMFLSIFVSRFKEKKNFVLHTIAIAWW